jgi:hypothetical protein
MADDIIQRVERYRFAGGNVLVERRNRGYSLHHADSGAPIARRRPKVPSGDRRAMDASTMEANAALRRSCGATAAKAIVRC